MKQKKLKVLLVTDFFYPHWTGIAKSQLNMIEMVKDQFDFTVLTVRYDKSLPYTETFHDISIIRVDYAFSLSRAKYSQAVVVECFSQIPKHDVVWINSPNTNILPIALIAKLNGKKLVTFHQGDLTLPSGFGNRVIEAVFDAATLSAFQLADRVSTYTTDYAQNSRVLKPFMKKFTPLLMPFLLEKPAKKLTSSLKELEKLKKNGVIVFGFAGRFVEEKGFDVLFKAIAKVKTKKKIIFAFAGETNMQYEKTFEKTKDLLEKVKDQVLFLGLLNNQELALFYKLINYIVVSSRSDCFPLVQAEACLSGAPTICADIPGARMIAKKTGYGVLFAKEDADDLAKTIQDVIKMDSKFTTKYSQVLQMLDNQKNAKEIANYIRQ